MSSETVSDERLAHMLALAEDGTYLDPVDAVSALRELQTLRSKPVASGVEVKPLVDFLWQEFCELTDRTSPEEYPDMAMVTLPELTAIIETYVERAALLPKVTAPVVSEPVAYLVKDKFAPSISPTVLMASSSVVPTVRLDTERFDLSPLYAFPQPQPKVVTDEMVERANRASVRVYVPGLSDEEYEQSRQDDPEGFDLTIKAMRAALETAMKEA